MTAEKNQKEELTLTPKLNLHYQDWHFGVAAQRVNDTTTKTYCQVAFNDKDNKYWARVNRFEKTAGVGFSMDHGCKQHSHELVYHSEKDFKGFRDFPVESNHGGEFECSENTSVSW